MYHSNNYLQPSRPRRQQQTDPHVNMNNNKAVPHMLKNMSSAIQQARSIMRRLKMRKYGRIIRFLYVQCIKASGKGCHYFRYIYQKIPVPEDGIDSIKKIRMYLSDYAGVQCSAICNDHGIEMGLLVKLTHKQHQVES